MARSVSVPRDAVKVAYACFNGEYPEDWDEAVSCVRRALLNKYPSLRRCSEWIGREDRAILANDLAFISVSEYCGLVALAAVPKNESAKAAAWCERVNLDLAASCFGDLLIKYGTFSNGEALFHRVALKGVAA